MIIEGLNESANFIVENKSTLLSNLYLKSNKNWTKITVNEAIANFIHKNKIIKFRINGQKEGGGIMSIYKEKDPMEFLFNGRKLQIFTIEKCVDFPKKYRPYLSQELVKVSANINERLVLANTIRPRNEFEKHKKLELFSDAIGYLNCFVEQLEMANELIKIDKKDLQKWAFIITEEIELIREEIENVQLIKK